MSPSNSGGSIMIISKEIEIGDDSNISVRG